MTGRPAELVADWNEAAIPSGLDHPVTLHDETLRDGLQSPSLRQPSLSDRLELLHLMVQLGIQSADLGMPISNSTSRQIVTRLAREIRDQRLPIEPTCAARTASADIAAVADVAQAAGTEISVMAFVGISPIRLYVEQWDLDHILREVDALVRFARREGLRVCLVTEDTTRSKLDVATAVYAAGLGAGADRICVCDTVGFALPWGAAELIRSLRAALVGSGFSDVGIDWHGHNDRGLALANSLAAASAGADRLHGTGLGIGERAGNTSMEQLLVNLREIGGTTFDTGPLVQYCARVADACAIIQPGNQPFVGADAYRTASGVHAAAIRKAMENGDEWIAERVYAGVPASRVGRQQTIEVGPGSGRSNILYWLERHSIAPDPSVITTLEQAVASANRTFVEEELLAIVASVEPSVAGSSSTSIITSLSGSR